MIRTSVVLLKPTTEQENVSFELLEHSARLWNSANYERRQVFFKKLDAPNSYSGQCRRFRTNEHFVALGNGMGQALLQKLRDSWMAFRELKRMEGENRLPQVIKAVRPPNYWKRSDGTLDPKLIAVRSDYWSMSEDTIILPRRMKVRYAGGRIWVGKRGRLEIRYEVSRRWYAYLPTIVDSPKPVQNHRKAAVDIGICNLVALSIEGVSRQWIWSGRQVLSDWRYWTKRISNYERMLMRTNGNHRSKELSRLFRVRTKRKNHAIRAMLRHLFEVLEENGVGLLKFGDLTGLRSRANYEDSTNQKIHNFWAFAQIRKWICELAEEKGIAVEPVDERGSSKTCVMHSDEQKGRIHRGLYRCRETGVSYNADAGGSVNLLYGNGKVAADGMEHPNLTSLSGSGLLAQPLLFRWDYREWKSGALSNNPTSIETGSAK